MTIQEQIDSIPITPSWLYTLCTEYLVKQKRMKAKVYRVPKEIDELVAGMKLKAINVKIDDLTEEQKRYLATWEEGTI